MTILYLNGDITASVVKSGFRVRFYDDFRSDLRFSCEIRNDSPEFSAGAEVRVFDGDSLFWGGIAETVTFVHRSGGRGRADFFCRGYEQVTMRRLINTFESAQTTTGGVASQFFNAYLGPVNGNDNIQEGFTSASDSFDTGVTLEGYSHPTDKASAILDDIAATAGFRWWITSGKVFYMKSAIAVTDTDVYINADSLSNDILSLEITKDLRNYRNEQSVYGENGSQATLTYPLEITRMKNLFGTGRYKASLTNSRILNDTDCTLTAFNLINCYAHEPIWLKIRSLRPDMKLYSRIYFRGSTYGLLFYAPYVITEVTGSYSGSRFVYEVKARRYEGESIRPQPYLIRRSLPIWQ